MDRGAIEGELRAKSRRDLIALASELNIAGRHRMRKRELTEAIVLTRIYRSLPESPEAVRFLTRKDLLWLCDLAGIRAKKRSKKSALVQAIEAAIAGKRSVEKPESPRPRFGEQERVEESKFHTALAAHEFPTGPGDLPDSYGETRVVLLPVDPYLVHVYWDVASGELEGAKKPLGEDYRRAQATLRFYDITYIMFDGTNAHSSFDVDIELQARNWYVHLWSPEKSYCVDLGFRTEDGRFVSIARSNIVETPRAMPSIRVEERYMLVEGDYERVEIVPLPMEYGIAPSRGAPTRAEVREEQVGIERIETGEARGIADAAEILRRKLAELYRFRRWGKPPSQPGLPLTQSLPPPLEEEDYFDLTEMSERKFTAGISSKG